MQQLSDDRRRWLALITVCFAQLMLTVDTSIVNVALPQIQHDLHFSQSSLTWVVNAFLVAFGSFLLLAGRLGDLAGRKRVFLAGLTVFTVASLLCGIANGSGLLIGARFLQGVGAAMQASVILAIIVTEFPEPEERARAMSAYVFAAVAGGSLGLLLGGALTQLLNWHWIFFVNIPIGLAVGMAGRVLIPHDRGIGFSEGIDWLGSLLVTVALAAAVYGFVEPSTHGWGSLHTLAPLALALVLLTAFVAVENRHPNPIFPLRILKLHGLVLSSAVRVLMVTGVYGMFFLGSLYLEKVLGYGAMDTGLAFLPYTVTVAILTLGVNRRLVARFGSVPVMAVGLAVAAAGILMLRLAGTHAGFFPFPFLAFLGMGLGIGNAFTPLTMISMAEVPPRDAGLASGIVNVSQQVAGALGLALLATIATGHSASLSRAGHGVDASLVGGYHLAFEFGAGALVVALILVVTVVRKHAPRPAPERVPNPQSAPVSQPHDESTSTAT
ncbi:MFS transporter [Embleya scabrispora]|uniref:MFS transporter n=1 Tax=Embleya scabrispora TaxID=159449 RepID=UPI00037C98BE|nr:MFS transporter [Embleya scabrispora]MYS82078.1 DHA2 family efflux MFS transporter permease subunit [Streptomyces sp. SID5474]